MSQTPHKRPAETYISGRPQQFLNINTGGGKSVIGISDAKVDGAFFAKDSVDLPSGRILEDGVYEFDALREQCFV